MSVAALTRIYERYRNQLFTVALFVTRCPERAEDAIHDTFHRLYRMDRKPLFLKAYVFRAVRNAAVDQVRQRGGVSVDMEQTIFDPGPGPRETSADREMKALLVQALTDLSEDEREVIVLHHYGELKFREIARMLETPMGTVVSRYRRGLEKLRRQMGETS